MGVFDKLIEKRQGNTGIYPAFCQWVDSVMAEDIPQTAKAISFNIYEEADNTFGIELIAAASYNSNDEDWACDEVLTTRDNPFYIQRTKNILKWEEGQAFICDLIKDYLNTGNYRDKLKSYTAVCAGFVDGNLELLFKKEELK
ncbi:MAG: hypothetical protein FWF33_01805 [Clostridiales bacterium]|nr:hypothetical protein [Clostridiales bacterium]